MNPRDINAAVDKLTTRAADRSRRYFVFTFGRCAGLSVRLSGFPPKLAELQRL